TFYFDQTSTYGRTISSLTNVLRNFSIAGGTVILGNPLNLANGVFSMSGGTIQLGNNDITLKSDNTASTMAQVGSLTNGIISYNGSGRFIAERAMTTARRGFRNLSSGGILSDADIWTNWQEGATTENYIPNFYYGMQITGGNYTGSSNAVDPVTGFDATRTGSPSLWTYGLANTYVPVTSTKGTILYPFVGYYAIVRGNRYYDLFSGGPALNEATSTTLRVKGKLLRGNVTLNTTNSAYTDPATNESVTGPATLFPGSNRYSLVGNPYASAINWASVYGASTNIRSAYYVWQQNIGSNTGGWATCDNLGLTTGGGNLNVFIQPGQSFFVKNVNVSGASPTISFTESVKAAANGNLTTTFDLGSPIHQIRFVLKKEVEGSLAGIDDALVAFREDFNNELNSDDVDKFPNTTENIFLFPNRRSTAIEKRALPTNKDTVVLRMTNLVVGTQYNIAVAAQQFTHNMDAFVWDRLTNTTTAVKKSDTTFISFTPTADTNTYFSRYYLVFRNPVPLSNGVSNLQGRQVGNNNAISWQATGEQTAGIVEYVVEKSANGQSFIVLATLTAKGGNNINQYQYIDENAAASNAYYRVRIVSGIETGKFTNTVQLKAANSKKQVSIYPTVITNQQFQLQLTGYEKGTYTVRVFNTIGQDIWTQKLQHEGGNSNYTIRMTETNLSSGTYFVHLYQNNGAVITQKIQIP
ncbi:MAG: T9SS type A sorting domain-containing protein, partial [Chitinophagaceae bacterium]